MPDKDNPNARRLYLDGDQENNKLPVSKEEKERDAQELIELGNDVKRRIASENISIPEITDLLLLADFALEVRDFMKASKIFKEILQVIGIYYRSGSRYKSFGLENDFPAFLK